MFFSRRSGPSLGLPSPRVIIGSNNHLKNGRHRRGRARDGARPFGLEGLESRRLFAVTVVEAYPGYYEIHGDESANNIAVSVSMTYETFTLDSVTYYGVSYISVFGYGGHDTISVMSTDGYGSIGAGISGGEGNDTINLNFDGGVWGGEGHDIITVTDSFYAQVHGEGGNDKLYIIGGCVGADIQGGDGNDIIDCSGATTTVIAYGGAGNDTIYGSAYDDQLYGGTGQDLLSGGAGNDTFYVQDGYNDQLVGGDGYDIAYVDSTEGGIRGVEEIIV